MDQFMQALESFKERAQDAIFALSSCMCQPSAKIKVNGRSFKIIRILGEGGFSFVYLAQDEHSGREFAMKKIRCPTGQEGVKEAMREVEAYRRFRHRNVIRIMDSAVVDDRDGDGKIVYLFLPYYRRGNLQDAINSNAVNGSRFSEREIVQLFLGTCQGVSALHDFRMVKPTSTNTTSTSGPSMTSNRHEDDESHDQDSLLPQADGDDEGGFSYHGSVPLSKRSRKPEREIEVVFDGDEEVDHMQQAAKNAPQGPTENVPYAHRDIKPANVMIDDDGAPILMDFGSTIKARIKVDTRSQALMQQDLAAEQSTMPYRAPELFDVKTGSTLDEKVDIWSLGCTLFALAYGHSPFETNQTVEQGGSMAMAVMTGTYKHPPNASYSEGLRNLIDSLMKLDPAQRPDIHQVIDQTQRLLSSLS